MRLHSMIVVLFCYTISSGILMSVENTKSPQWNSATVTAYVTKLELPESAQSTPSSRQSTPAPSDDDESIIKKTNLVVKLIGSASSLPDIEDCATPLVPSPTWSKNRYQSRQSSRNSISGMDDFACHHRTDDPSDHGYGTPEKPKSPKSKRLGRVQSSPTDHGYSTPPDPNKPKTPEKK
ncbi:hypothetical protein KAZ82_01910 [Candidatus Babeliales bacterium]|nr:hypothetical protein [Candidatus Babeliales bacterium]